MKIHGPKVKRGLQLGIEINILCQNIKEDSSFITFIKPSRLQTFLFFCQRMRFNWKSILKQLYKLKYYTTCD